VQYYQVMQNCFAMLRQGSSITGRSTALVGMLTEKLSPPDVRTGATLFPGE
jgi:hypothetical protein